MATMLSLSIIRNRRFPPTLEVHAARLDHVGDGHFDLAVPMRRGWNTVMSKATIEACLKEFSESIRI
jgi:hypothetical protein